VNWQAPNLARDPFVNLRPLVRTSAALTVAALLLTGWNVVSYLRAGSGAAGLEGELARVTSETEAAKARLATIERDLAAHDLATENRKAEFLNARIAERTFSWNRLLTNLAAAAPRGVRIRSLSPSFGKVGSGAAARPASAGASGSVALAIQGEAEDGEALLEFVDRLFAHPAFDSPKLTREGKQGGEITSFSLNVAYLPESAPVAAPESPRPPAPETAAPSAEEPVPESAEEDAP
jgi:hypothetical protein